MHRNKILYSAFVLTLAGIITRILGFVYRIYMSNTIGAEGMGLYQLIMPVYGLAWSLACSGFTTTVSKLVAEEKAKGEYGNMSRILKICVVTSTSIGILISIILFFTSSALAEYFFKDTRVFLPLEILALAIPFMAAGSCFRGYFFGLQESVVPAINQVFEQCVRMAVIFMLASTLVPLGLTYACAAAVIGITAEEFFSMIYIIISYNHYKKKNFVKQLPSQSISNCSNIIFAMALPLTLNRVTGSLLSTLENTLIPQRLQLYGYSANQSIGIYGQITGMAMPLIYFPSAFLVSLSISLVPAVAEALAGKNFANINKTLSKSMLFASVTGFGAACVFITFATPLGEVIFNQDIGYILTILGIMCPFLYMQVVLSGILNGLGYQVFIFRNSLISSFINIAFVYFLVPFYGINGFLMGWFLSLIVTCALDMSKIRNSIDLQFEFKNWFLKPLISSLGAAIITNFLIKVMVHNILGDVSALLLGITILSALYMLFIVLTGCLSIGEIKAVLKNLKPKKKIRESDIEPIVE